MGASLAVVARYQQKDRKNKRTKYCMLIATDTTLGPFTTYGDALI